jgi:uncharacterized membrane protein
MKRKSIVAPIAGILLALTMTTMRVLAIIASNDSEYTMSSVPSIMLYALIFVVCTVFLIKRIRGKQTALQPVETDTTTPKNN